MGSATGEEFALEDLTLTLVAGERLAATLAIGSSRWPEPVGEVGRVELRCPALELRTGRLRCPSARTDAALGPLDLSAATVAFTVSRAPFAVSLLIEGARLDDGRLTLSVDGAPADLDLRLELDGVPLRDVLAAADLPAADGRLDGRVTAEGGAGSRWAGAFDIAASDVTGASADGLTAAEEVAAELAGEFRTASGLELDGRLRLRAGQVYVDPVFIDLDAQPGSVAARVRRRGDAIALERVEIVQPGVISASGELSVDPAGPRLVAADVEIAEAALGPAYRLYLQPFAIGTPADALTADGTVRGRFGWSDGRLAGAAAAGAGLSVAHEDGRFAVEGFGIDFDWSRAPESEGALWLTWTSARVYDMALGPTMAEGSLGADRLRLERPVRIPFLDGALELRDVSGGGWLGGSPEWSLAAALEPVDLAALTNALGWPELGGTVSGELPSTRYADGTLAADGRLSVEIFDGRLTVDGLRLAQAFGPLPRLRADVRFERIDLAELTSAFALGRMTGRVEGRIADLRLLGWQPVAFDAMIRSEEARSERRRISQRAVDQLTSIGAGGALSGTFIGLFDEFSYDELALGCRLANDVCRMEGLGPAPGGGYYIVRGRGLPRIDVIGSAERVSFSRLVEQLGSLRRAGEARVE